MKDQVIRYISSKFYENKNSGQYCQSNVVDLASPHVTLLKINSFRDIFNYFANY